MADAHPLDFYPDEETGDELVDSLALIDKAQAALARAQTLPEIGDVMAAADRALRFIRRARVGKDAEIRAMRLRVDAERKAGGVLKTTPRQRRGGDRRSMSSETTLMPSLKDLGVSRDEASRWVAYDDMSDDEWEAFKDEVLAERGALESKQLLLRLREQRVAARRAAARSAPLPDLPPDVVLEVADARAMPLGDDTVDLIVTSPPYGLDVAYEGGDVDADAWPAFMLEWLAEALRVTRPSGRLALNVPLDMSEPYFRPAYVQSVMAAVRAGWEYRSTVVWDEGNGPKGNRALGSIASAARPHHISQAEMIPLFSKGAWGPSSEHADDLTLDEFQVAGRGPWRFGGETRAWEGHPAPFPLEVPRRLIPYLCRVGDVVLDPFCGSGTTLLAARERGRRAVGFDISPEYVGSARRRLAAVLS